MNTVEKTLVTILDDNVTYNDTIVPVIVINRYSDSTPTITITTATSHYIEPRYNETLFLPVNNTHPQYDASNPNKKIAQDAVIQEEEITLEINVWANNEDERHNILNQVKTLINQAVNFHYTTCTYYNETNHNCLNLNTTCKAFNGTDTRSLKGQCPEPSTNGYESIFKKNMIKHGTFNMFNEFNIDELGLNPPILRTVLKLTVTLYDYYTRGGKESNTYEINEII